MNLTLARRKAKKQLNGLISFFLQASRKVCAAVKSGVRVAKSTAGNGCDGIKIITGK